MATMHQSFISPEAGWKRYDDTHATIKYTSLPEDPPNAAFYNSTIRYIFVTNGVKVEFDFLGSGMRIISSISPNYSQTENTILIDGVEHKYKQYNATRNEQKVMVYEIDGLEHKRHTVRIMPPDGVSFGVDAIDLKQGGRLLHPDEVLTPEELQIGKRIRCHYTGAVGVVGTFSHLGKESYIDGMKDFIPTTGTIAPNGDFYFVMVRLKNGKKILVADRNVQAGISWAAINDFGYASGIMLQTTESQVPEMYSFVSSDGQVIHSARPDAQPDVWKAFNSVGGMTGRAGLGSVPLYVGFHFNEPKVIQAYKLVPYSSNRNHDPRTWEFQASNDGTNWDVLHSVIGEGANGATRTYTFTNTKAYKMYRWYVTVKNSGSWPDLWIDGLELLGYSEKTVKNEAIVRLMTGGIDTSTKGEWDEYILDTDLNRIIPIGGNNVFWNLGPGLSASDNQHWTSTTPTSLTANKIARNLSGQSSISSTTTSGTYVFRPLMELMVDSENTEPSYERNFLVNDGGVIKTFNQDTLSWVELGNEPATVTMFEDGFGNISLIAPYVDDLTSDTLEILMMDETPEISQVRFIMDAVPSDVIVEHTSDIDMSNAYAIDYIRVTGTFNDRFRAVVSFDGGLTWMTKKNGVWTTLELNAETMTATGMTNTEFNALSRFDWESNLQEAKKIRFAFLLSIEQTADVLSINEITSQIDMHGRWMRARDADWEYISNRNLKVIVYRDGDYKIIY